MTSTPNKQKKLLIFDLDGTLIDSVPDIATATNRMLIDIEKSPCSEEQIRNWVGNGARTLIERALMYVFGVELISDFSD